MKKFYIILVLFLISMSALNSCTPTDSQQNEATLAEVNLWPQYSKESTTFKIWSPEAHEVRLNLYESGNDSPSIEEHNLQKNANGVWSVTVSRDLNGVYYTYQVRTANGWQKKTPGIYAQAVGVNGQRAMVVDLEKTNIEGWNNDEGPSLAYPNEAIIYELHVRDLSIHPESGISNKGTFLAFTEQGTTGASGQATGLDHLKELGITHVHLLPAFDYASIDETRLDTPQFNWGYDPLNYNVPEGSYSTDPYKAEVRIREFKQMVKSLHDNKIGVILDVVYNHTGGSLENSNFNQEYPGYYYRKWQDGRFSDASACGNETASDKEMMRKFIIESVSYWAREYHIDGFRFDLMAIHDIATMNEITTALKAINPDIIIYGEGWTAGDSPLPVADRALKAHTFKMPQVSAFSDDFRDGLKGSVFDDMSTGFVNGGEGTEESIKFGVVGSLGHPQIDFGRVNYSDTAWTRAPWQSVSYVSCHDNRTIYDKLKLSRPDLARESLVAMDKLANAIVLTSQGIAFIHAGAEMLRTKEGHHNSYNLPDSINQIDWQMKVEHKEVVAYYSNLIKLRRQHPAFRMPTEGEVINNLQFITTEPGLISYQLLNNANGDSWKNILVIYNARHEAVDYTLDGSWSLALLGDEFNSGQEIQGLVSVPAISTLIAYQE